jgi:hypothetical protein
MCFLLPHQKLYADECMLFVPSFFRNRSDDNDMVFGEPRDFCVYQNGQLFPRCLEERTESFGSRLMRRLGISKCYNSCLFSSLSGPFLALRIIKACFLLLFCFFQHTFAFNFTKKGDEVDACISVPLVQDYRHYL